MDVAIHRVARAIGDVRRDWDHLVLWNQPAHELIERWVGFLEPRPFASAVAESVLASRYLGTQREE